MKWQQRGFTLIELAIVMLVLTILAAGLLVPLTTSIETRRIQATNQDIAKIQDALIGYAMSHTHVCSCTYDNVLGNLQSGSCPTANPCPPSSPVSLVALVSSPTTLTMTRHYLPCPDVDSDGQEDRDPATHECTIYANSSANADPSGHSHPGWLPWVTLGIPETDAWGNRYAYDVYLPYANSQVGFSTTLPPDPTHSLAGEVYVCSASGCTLPTPLGPLPTPSPYLAAQIPAVVISYGPDGQGAFSSNNKKWEVMPSATGAPDELQNVTYGRSTSNRAYVRRPPTEAGGPGGSFDDLVAWLSWPALVGRVCQAGGCP